MRNFQNTFETLKGSFTSVFLVSMIVTSLSILIILWQQIDLSFIVTAGDKIYRFQEDQDKVNECNHEKVDTTIVLLALQETSDVTVISKDTAVLVLLVKAYAHHNIKRNWFFE